MTKYLFVGPSANEASFGLAKELGLVVLPPVKRGDVRGLAQAQEAGQIIIADGVFGHVPAVSHDELVGAIDEGWAIVGVSSLGAIRAYELRDHGMIGFGWVYQQFFKHDDFTDDELCLFHTPEPPYRTITEPLVNIRYLLDCCAVSFGIDEEACLNIIDDLAQLWFGDRSLDVVRRTIIKRARILSSDLEELMNLIPSHRIKSIDLESLLTSFGAKHDN